MPAAEQLSVYWRLTKPRIWGLLVFTGLVALLVVDVLLFFVSSATFRREEILTKWK